MSVLEQGSVATSNDKARNLRLRRPTSAGRVLPQERHAFDDMRDWLPILSRLGIAAVEAETVALRAQTNRTQFLAELLAAELCEEDRLFEAVAQQFALAFSREIDPTRLILRDDDLALLLGRGKQMARLLPVLYVQPNGPPSQLVGAGLLDLRSLRRTLGEHPELTSRIVVVPPKALRAALKQRAAPGLADRACTHLVNTAPDCSARVVASAWQGCMIGAVIIALPIAGALWPMATLLAVHAFFSLFFLAGITLRMRAARHAATPYLKRLPPVAAKDLPTYSVMIALYREADVVPELVEALGRLVWPRAKLEIKLVCEADDDETLDALRAQPLRPWIEVIEVPSVGPRTKPKALSYALPLTSGDLVAVYDAEDKPHPLQLVEAWQTFQRLPAEVACLQAPLVITNFGEGAIPRLFGFEYAALFRGLLPWLAAKTLVLPLGGTSNHFRRDALDDVGGWDPFNVTEDADLGLRLTRFGYRCATITYPTFEEAPTTLKQWLPQRTRWFKGWLQTWLVHMRHPLRLWREIGTGSFLLVQILFAGMVISAIAHPLLLATLAGIVVELVGNAEMDARRSLLFAVDAINITCGYAAFLVLGAATLTKREREGRSLFKLVVATPVYWMMISLAAWRAAWHLYSKPFHWEKTPHRQSRSIWVRRLRS